VEIVPGVGLPFARLGDTLHDIEAVAGPAEAHGAYGALWKTHSPPFGMYFGADARCDLIEVYASEREQNDLTLGGVQLVGRLMSEVEEELSRIGRSGRRTCLTVDFDDGLTLWSLDEISPGPGPDIGGPGVVVEGVAITALPASSDSRLIPVAW
jgi:hypothetical protein